MPANESGHKPLNFIADRVNAGESPGVRAARIGIARGTLEAVEANPAKMPNYATAKKIADFHNCLVTDLWPVEPLKEAA